MSLHERKIALAVEYDGSCFHGWQRQENAISVQETLEEAWFHLTGEKRAIIGCSRTDQGVSARCHISHLFTTTPIPDERIFLALNTKLPEGITVLAARAVPLDFHARFQACGKTYSYRLLCSQSRPAIERRITAWMPQDLDYRAMLECSRHFIGEHDFTALMDQGSNTRRSVRRIYRLELQRQERDVLTGTEYILKITGDGFLFHMVRILMGTIAEAGQGKLNPADIPDLLQAKDRTKMGKTMPPEGLTLDKVYYRENLFGEGAWPYEPDSLEEI